MFYTVFTNLCGKNNISPTATLQKLGVSTSKLTAWKNGSDPSVKVLLLLSEFFSVSVDFLLTGKEKNVSNSIQAPEQKHSSSENSSEIANYLNAASDYLLAEEAKGTTLKLDDNEKKLITIFHKLSPINKARLQERATVLEELEADKAKRAAKRLKIKHSYYRVSAGTGFGIDGDDEWETIEVPDTPEARKADFALTITGNSMTPIFADGDIVLVKRQPTVERGEIGIFYIEGNGYIKKFGGDRLISINNDYDDIILSEYDAERTVCFGKVLGHV